MSRESRDIIGIGICVSYVVSFILIATSAVMLGIILLIANLVVAMIFTFYIVNENLNKQLGEGGKFVRVADIPKEIKERYGTKGPFLGRVINADGKKNLFYDDGKSFEEIKEFYHTWLNRRKVWLPVVSKLQGSFDDDVEVYVRGDIAENTVFKGNFLGVVAGYVRQGCHFKNIEAAYFKKGSQGNVTVEKNANIRLARNQSIGGNLCINGKLLKLNFTVNGMAIIGSIDHSFSGIVKWGCAILNGIIVVENGKKTGRNSGHDYSGYQVNNINSSLRSRNYETNNTVVQKNWLNIKKQNGETSSNNGININHGLESYRSEGG